MSLTHEQWLDLDLTKHHRTKGSIAIKTREEIARELDRLLDTDIHNIADKDIWILDIDLSDSAVMSMRETQYVIFEQKAVQAQDKAVAKRTDGKTRDFKEHCKISEMCGT